MLDHITIGVTDIARARAFFDVALAPLGVAYMFGDQTIASRAMATASGPSSGWG